MPKPSVVLCSPKPMISTVASPMAPAFADTPIARPSAKLCKPDRDRDGHANVERPLARLQRSLIGWRSAYRRHSGREDRLG